ncbi:MAG: PhnD/SsuA/transferrin family substrate-binding protein [Pseudomonadota bacterium]
MYRLLIAWLACSLLAWAPAVQAAREFVVGVLPYQGARTLIAEHHALAAHLRVALKRPVRIVTARNTVVFGQRMLAGDYDLALAPAHLARLAQIEHRWQPVARYAPDTPVYLLATTSRPGTPLARGAVVAVPDRAMLITLAAETWLAEHRHLNIGDYTLLETGGHSASVQAVLDGRADFAVGALAGMPFVRKDNIERVRIVHEIGTVPLLVFSARGDLPAATLASLQRALLKYAVRAPLRILAANHRTLAGMDRYLQRTRRLLAEREGDPHAN